MKRRIVFLIVLATASLGAGAPAGPRIKVPDVRYDFGTVKAGNLQEHLFLIKNEGTDELVIQKVQPS